VARHHEHVRAEPRAIDLGEARVVELLDVDAEHLDADLAAQRPNRGHGLSPQACSP